MPTIADITINGHTYTDAMWRADPEGTLSGIGNDIATLQGALADSLGILTKAISGDTTLSGTESTNIGFVFTGSLSANATITFAAGFSGIAQIENQTTGGYELVCGLASGDQVTCPAGGSCAAFCDGSDFSLRSGVVRTSGGAQVVGSFLLTGALTVTSNASITGSVTVGGLTGTTANFSGNQTVGGAQSVSGAQNVTGAITGNSTISVSGAGTIGGAMSVGGAMTVGGAVSILSDTFLLYNDAGDAFLTIDAASGSSAWCSFSNDNNERWLIGKNQIAESGSNVGSNFQIISFDDAGAQLLVPVEIKRDSGNIVLANLPTSASGLVAGTLWNNSGVVNIV